LVSVHEAPVIIIYIKLLIVDRAILLWSFDVHRMGHLQNVMTYRDLDLTLAGCIEFSCVFAPEKSASA
jgi:hypothetical protein